MTNLLGWVLIFILIVNCSSLYEDQIGKFDWKKEYVGIPNRVMFDTTSSVGKHVIIQSKSNIIACLNAKNGQINWRKVFGENDGRLIESTVSNNEVVIVMSNGVVYSFEMTSGNLIWEENLSENENFKEFTKVNVAVIPLSYSEGKVVLVLSQKALYGIKLAPGNDQSVTVFPLDDEPDSINMLYFDIGEKLAVVVNLIQGVQITSQTVNIANLQKIEKQVIPATWLSDAKKAVMVGNGIIVYHNEGMESFTVVNVFDGKELYHQLLAEFNIGNNLFTIGEHSRWVHTRDLNKISNYFTVTNDEDEAYEFKLEDNKVKLVSRLTLKQNSLFVSSYVGNEKYIFNSVVNGDKITISALNAKTNIVNSDLTLAVVLPKSFGKVADIYINMFMKRSSDVGFRAVIVSTGGTVNMITQPSRISWQREESLAEVKYAEMLDLPLSDLAAKIEVEFQQTEEMNVVEMLIKRLEAQIQQLQSFATTVMKEFHDGTLFQTKSKDPLIQEEELIRDQFSLHKMLVLVTKSGKVFGIDSLSGRIVWQFYADKFVDDNFKYFTQRTTAHFPHPPQSALVGSAGPKKCLIVLFNPITGKIEGNSYIDLKSDLSYTFTLPFLDSTFLRGIVLLDTKLNVYFEPNTKEITERFQELSCPYYLYLALNNSINGYRILKNLRIEKTWGINFPENQYLTTVKGKMFNEKVDSIGRPLANRSVIYKYLNPNAVAVVTESGDKNIDRAYLTFFIIDAVTGHVIHSAVYKKATSPVHIVNSENWLVFSYKNTKSRRYEIASLELYEGSSLHNDTAFSSFHVRPNIQILQQAYILPSKVNALGASVTEKGLTTRQILFGFSKGSILGLPRRFLDPRRPMMQQQSDREEGLMQYVPEIPLPTELIINYNQTINRINAIYTCPSALESTSIVFVTGLDLFFTRTQPSKMFDVLKEDFDYILISSVLLGMLVAAIVTRKLSQNKTLNRAWK